jgi:molybdate transport system substrate-binding protein
MKRLWIAVICLAFGATGGAAQDAAPSSEVTVFAAASLTEAFRELGPKLAERRPGTVVKFNFAGSQQLAVQIEQGAPADVFASADQRWMDYARERQLMEGEPRIFTNNRLVAIVPKSNPGRIRRLEDLAKRGIKLVLGAEAVPVGKYSREVIANLERVQGFPERYSAKVLGNLVSQEENVKSVVSKVQLGEADAGLVYRSDVTPQVARYLTVLEIPSEASVLASYPIAVVAASENPEGARAFMDLVTSAEGQAVLTRHGLMPVGATP